MRLLTCIAITTISLLPGASLAQEGLPLAKVKTGILPSGGFYSIYEVSCGDNSTANVASMDRRTRWCAVSDGDLSCYRLADQASEKACGLRLIAANDRLPLASAD